MKKSAAGRLTPAALRRLILEESKRAHVGHIGCALSVAELIVALHGHVLDVHSPDDPDRDRFILSKGHAALAVYAALHLRGLVSREMLDEYCSDGTLLGVHPDHRLKGIDFSTGSLGHGLPIGTGAALAARLEGGRRAVVVLMSDGECNEGSVWEAAMFAAHHRLANLYAVIDANGQQAFGYTNGVLDLEPLAERWRAFGWDAREVDGHDVDAILAAMAQMRLIATQPHVLIARTVFGRGVSFMESRLEWHYSPLSEEEYARAIDELAGRA